MEIIYSQNIHEGYWEINSKTGFVKEKYSKKFNKLKEKNYDDITAITFLIIYFILVKWIENAQPLKLIVKKQDYISKIKIKFHLKN